MKSTRLMLSALLAGSVLTSHAATAANADKQIASFVKLNSWYCEAPLNGVAELVNQLKKDARLQEDSATRRYRWKAASEDVSVMAHQQGCATVLQLDANDKASLKQLISALKERGYQQLSQQVGYTSGQLSQKKMVSETLFERKGNKAVLIYPIDGTGQQELSLITANYTQRTVAQTNKQTVSLDERIRMHRQNAGERTQNGWYQADSSKGSYSVLLPLKFNDFSVAGDKEKVRSVEMLTTQSREGIKLRASRTFYTDPALAQTFFDSFVSGKVAPKTPRRVLKHQGYDAVLLEAADQKNATSQLVMKVDNTLVLLSLEWPVQYSAAAKKLGNVFFNSFTVN